MAFIQQNSLKYFTFEIFEGVRITHGVFTRQGGVSPAPWSSLNTGGMSGDARENVVENRRRIFDVLNRPVESIFDVWQVHSADVVVTNLPRPLTQPHQKADAIVTDRPGITLFMRFGDCVPILFFDPIHQVVAIAHAGWQGTLARIVQATINEMKNCYHSQPQDLLAGIGPSICVDHYQFGGDGLERVRQAFKNEEGQVLTTHDGITCFDLWKANHLLLLQAGLKPDHIQVSGICTAEHTQDWYSHRAENGKTGRFGVLLGLQ